MSSKRQHKRRKLTHDEINDILDLVQPNPSIPEDTARSIVEQTTESLRPDLEKLTIHPEMLPQLKKWVLNYYRSTLIQPGECVGIITAQSIGERQTQSNLNNFHRAGSSDKQPVVSKFSELLNATSNPKSPGYLVYFRKPQGDTPRTVSELRNIIGHSLVQLCLKKIALDYTVCVDKTPEPWYEVFYMLHGREPITYTDCISVQVNMDIMYEYRLTLREVCEVLCQEYADVQCVYSPDCYGQIDIYFDTATIDLPEEKFSYVTAENAREVYLEEVVQPILEGIRLCGIPGVSNIFFMKEKDEWIVETENVREKVVDSNNKAISSAKRYKYVLSHPDVDMTRTLSNNVWDIYYTFGIEAVRQHMIEEFSKIMEGINTCHIMILVDKMTHSGSISSISRYTMRREDSGPLSKSSFEETLDNFLNAGAFGQDETTRGVSAAIICGKMASIGTGFFDLEVDLEKLMTIPIVTEEETEEIAETAEETED